MVKPFTCYAEAFPSARYYWNFEEGNFTTVGPTLTFRHGIRRYQVGGASVVLLFVFCNIDQTNLSVPPNISKYSRITVICIPSLVATFIRRSNNR